MAGQVSVVIPVRDGERYLGEAIQSVLGQTRAALEVIVVDNGSRDKSREIASGFGGIVRVIDEAAPGAARARNAGVAIASGELIAFVDADDLWEPSKLACQVEILSAQPEIDLVFAMVRDFVSPELTDQQKAGMSLRSGAYSGLLPSTMLARARAFGAAGLFPDVAVGEFIAWYGLAQTAGLKGHLIPDVLVHRRIHLRNTTRRNDRSGYVMAAKTVLDSRRAQDRRRGV